MTDETVPVNEPVLSRNAIAAEENRALFLARGLLVVNVLSSPGSGKTSFIERTLRDRPDDLRAGVVVGDLQTDNDARRIQATGAPAVQITTGTVCHLDAEMVSRAVGDLDLDGMDVLIVENVGNLVCPASYDLGEALRVVLLSVTEGEDKPLKYPTMFKRANVVILNKMDLAEVVGFDRALCMDSIGRAAPGARVFEVSARTGHGMDQWYGFLREARQARIGTVTSR